MGPGSLLAARALPRPPPTCHPPPVRILVGVLCLVGLVVLLAEFFSVFLLPRRVKRDPRIVRGVLRG
ncbi:MAG TPA: hypothetical protein VLP43_05570, partial [Solirubrobacteraceae bacterium]|nr:hypothetical protein [Solirubrobacteraceae bacterium]